MNGIDRGGKGMCISDPNLGPYSRDPCPFCKRDREHPDAPRKSFSQALQCEAEERRKRRRVEGPVRVSVSLYTGGFRLVGLILRVTRLSVSNLCLLTAACRALVRIRNVLLQVPKN